MKLLFALVFALVCAGLSHAAKLTGATPAELRTYHSGLQTSLDKGAIVGLREVERRRLTSQLDQLLGLLDEHASWDMLSQDDRVRVVNLNEQIAGTLESLDKRAERMVCKQRAPTGSHMRKTTCKTQGEMAADEREAQKMMSDLGVQPQLSNGGN